MSRVGNTSVFFASRIVGNVGFYKSTDFFTLGLSGAPTHPMFQVYQCVTDRQSRKVFIGYGGERSTTPM